MKVLANGYFSDEFSGENLSKGLRTSNHMGRNNKFLTVCKGAVGRDGVLGTVPTLNLNTITNSVLVVKDDFPFPQIFTTEKHTIVCNRTSILEEFNGALILKLNVTTGGAWSLVSFENFIYLSNKVVAVIRDPFNGTYSISSTLPKSSALCNFNGQVIIGNYS
jgi:hypothetical protein